MTTPTESEKEPEEGQNEVERADVVVIGAGIAGLIVADRAAAAGLHVLVLDAADVPGGCVARHEVGGLALDAGAESYATRSTAVADLARDLGLGDELVTPDPAGAWVAHRDGTWPLPRAGLLGIPTDLDDPSLHAALGPDALARARRDATDPVPAELTPGAPTPPSLGTVVRTRMGEQVLDRLVRPIVSGVHAADPDALDAQAVAPGLLAALEETGSLAAGVARLRSTAKAGSAVGSVRGGMHRLVDALADRIQAAGGTIHTGRAVTGLHRTDDTWLLTTEQVTTEQVTTADGPHGPILADHVVLAAGAGTAVPLLTGLFPSLADLPAPTGAPVTLATLVVRSTALDTHPRGTGVLVGEDVPGVEAKALTHATAKWEWLADAAAETAGPGVHVVRLSYGRPGEDASRYADDAHVLETARRDAATLLGVELGGPDSEVLDGDVVRWPGALPAAGPGHAGRVARIRTAASSVRPAGNGKHDTGPSAFAVVGGWLAGNGLAAVVADSRAQAAQLFDNM
ncbi:FAD-dependent oxidoreductase [Tersicoccus sp. MR15.9]|uniref:protoporphyrinogen/coproporphyrinogen oxidase n=1 Tax=Tersicoccus mangrovi TaxID=3121635 RepID=UPI002FE67211